MRKFLLAVLAILILVLTFFFVRDGLALGNFKVSGVYDIKSQGEELDGKISEATELTTVKVKTENEELEKSLVEVETQKQKYEKILAQTSKKDLEEALKKEQYEIEKLWISVGNYAKEHGVVVNMQITNGASGITGVKDLNFIVNGSYVGITEFVYDLEDDEELGFKIESFKLIPDKEKSNLKATFSVKDIYVNIENNVETTTTTTTDTANNTENTENKTSNTVNQNTVNEDKNNKNTSSQNTSAGNAVN